MSALFAFDGSERGLCRGGDPDIWFSDDPIVTARAISTCNRCPVRRQCYDFAVTTGQYGTWGGVSEAERRSARQSRVVVRGTRIKV